MGNDQHMNKQGHGVCKQLYQKVKGWRYEKLQPVWNHCFIQLHTHTLTYTCIKYIPAYVCMYTDTYTYVCMCLWVIKNVLTKLNNLCDWALFKPCNWLIFSRSRRILFFFQAVFVFPWLLPLQSLLLTDLNKLKSSMLMRSTAWVYEMLRYDSQRKTSSPTNVIKGQSVKNLKN